MKPAPRALRSFTLIVLAGAAWLVLSQGTLVEAVVRPAPPTVIGGYDPGPPSPASFFFRIRISPIPWDPGDGTPEPRYDILLVQTPSGDPFDRFNCNDSNPCYLQGDTTVSSTTPVRQLFPWWQSRNILRGIPIEHRSLSFYAFRVRAYQGDPSSTSERQTGRVPPGPPQGFQVSGGERVQLSWSPPDRGAEGGYGVFRAMTPSAPFSAFTLIGTPTNSPFTDTTIQSSGPARIPQPSVVMTAAPALELRWSVPLVEPVIGYYRVEGYHQTGPDGPEFGWPTATTSAIFQPVVSSYTVRAVRQEGDPTRTEFSVSTTSFLISAMLVSNVRHAFEVRGITQDGVSGREWSPAISTYTLLRVRNTSFSIVEATRLAIGTEFDNPRYREVGSQSAARLGYAPLSGGVTTWCSASGDGWVTDDPVRCDVRTLEVSTPYRFTVETKNFAGVLGSSSVVKATKATVPPRPRILNVRSSFVKLAVDPGTNPTDTRTEFAMFVEGSNGTRGYVQLLSSPDGVDRGGVLDRESWGTYVGPNGWGGRDDGITVIGLTPEVTYSFKVKARNQDRETTDFSPPVGVTLHEGGVQPPAVERVEPSVSANQWINQTTFTFTLRGQPNQLRLRWDQDQQGRVAQTDELWTGSPVTKRATAEGPWFLHLLGRDPGTDRDVQVDFGPILIDTTPPVIPRVLAKFGPDEEEPIPEQETSYNPNPYFFWPVPASASPMAGYCTQILPEPQDRELTCTAIQIQASTTTAPGVRITNLASGRYRFRVKAKDLAGNWSPTSAVFTLNLTRDDQPATMTFQSPQTTIGDFLFGAQLQPPIRFTFNDQMATTTFPRGMTLRRIWRHDGLPGTEGIPLTFEAVLNGGQTQLTATPQAPLPKGSVFLLQATPALKDKGGNPIQPFSVHFRTVLDRTQRNTVFRATQPETRVLIPQNVLPDDSFPVVELDPLATAPETVRRAVTDANAKLQGEGPFTFIVPNSIRGFELRDATNHPLSTQFPEDALISLPYQDNEQGLVTGSPVPTRAKRLSLAFLDEQQHRWITLQSQVDLAAKTVQAPTRHFSIYSLMANPDFSLADVIVYPVPFAPNSGDPNQGTEASGITFANLSTQATIKIYTLSGELVRTLDHTSGLSTLQWDTANDEGQKVFSGVYLWLVQNAREKKTGKLVIIR
ncbi:MAG: hypothetical protein HYZ73_09480 [Elusimicrobia bacterium]|nr:hypothetical protein [Elusimicrobiota bacterium]